MSGCRIHYVHALHSRYGPIVRISPFQVAVADPEGFTAIHRIGSGFVKTQWYEDFSGGSGIGIGVFAMTDTKRHAARRKLFARAFSTADIRQNCESVVREKVVKAVDRINDEAMNGSADVLHWWLLMAAISATLSYELPWLHKISGYIPIKALQRVLNSGNKVSEYCGKAVSNLMRHRDNKANIFANMLAECDANEKVDLTPQDIRIEANNFIFAGADNIIDTYLPRLGFAQET
ncbi:putative sterigmatocystin biosynthesis P450 monooxygenase STCB [Colletotrichum viniferum]|nr:putative sterigmatocystin biosynthesis P450 monooxygenase STCB [Colletotrichum viniferum]